MGFTSFRGLGFISFRMLPYPPGYFRDSFVDEKSSSPPFPLTFWSQRVNQISLLDSGEGSSRTFASRLTLTNWLEGIPILVMCYLFFSPLHTFDGESPGGADA
jgi:hypothetical protein